MKFYDRAGKRRISQMPFVGQIAEEQLPLDIMAVSSYGDYARCVLRVYTRTERQAIRSLMGRINAVYNPCKFVFADSLFSADTDVESYPIGSFILREFHVSTTTAFDGTYVVVGTGKLYFNGRGGAELCEV